MSEKFPEQAEPLDVVEEPERVIAVAGRAPILITEQQVAFSTAAAMAREMRRL